MAARSLRRRMLSCGGYCGAARSGLYVESGQIFLCVIVAGSAGIFTKLHIQDPVLGILNGPVTVHGGSKPLWLCERAQEIAILFLPAARLGVRCALTRSARRRLRLSLFRWLICGFEASFDRFLKKLW